MGEATENMKRGKGEDQVFSLAGTEWNPMDAISIGHFQTKVKTVLIWMTDLEF